MIRRRRAVVAGLLIVALLALSGCHAGSQIVVHPDGSGTFAAVITVEGAAGEALYQSVVKAEASSTVPLTVSRYTAGAESGAKIAVPFKSLTDLTALGVSLGSTTGLAGITVTRAASGWTFAASSNGGLVRPPGAAVGSPGGSIDGSQLGGMVHMSVALDLPGAPGKTNADQVTHTADSTQFVWNLAAGRTATDLSARTTFVGDQRSVKLSTTLTKLKTTESPVAAISTPDSAGGGGVSIGAAVLAVLLAVAGLLLLRRRRARTV